MDFLPDIASEDDRPSLFELVAQEQLRDILQPALRYVLSVFAQRNPRYLLRIVNRHDEFYSAIMFFVERYHLQNKDSSFAEHLYGLKRRRKPVVNTQRTRLAVGNNLPEEKLRRRDINRSLISLIGIPYLRAKAQEYYESLGGGIDPDLMTDESETRRSLENETTASHLRLAYKRWYPLMTAAYEVWLLVYNIAYLTERTSFYRPWLRWIGIDLRRRSAADFADSLSFKPISDPETKRNILALLRGLLLSFPRRILESLKHALPIAVFFIKFLEWWYSPSSPARMLVAAPKGPHIGPPRLLSPHPRGLQVTGLRYGECSICRGPIHNPTALPSGYVFCYRCAYGAVEKDKRCPVTFLPAQIEQLRKVLL